MSTQKAIKVIAKYNALKLAAEIIAHDQAMTSLFDSLDEEDRDLFEEEMTKAFKALGRQLNKRANDLNTKYKQQLPDLVSESQQGIVHNAYEEN